MTEPDTRLLSVREVEALVGAERDVAADAPTRCFERPSSNSTPQSDKGAPTVARVRVTAGADCGAGTRTLVDTVARIPATDGRRVHWVLVWGLPVVVCAAVGMVVGTQQRTDPRGGPPRSTQPSVGGAASPVADPSSTPASAESGDRVEGYVRAVTQPPVDEHDPQGQRSRTAQVHDAIDALARGHLELARDRYRALAEQTGEDVFESMATTLERQMTCAAEPSAGRCP